MKKFNNIIAFSISFIILSLSILFIFSKKQDYSENEFRYLTKMPSFSFNKLLNGSYIEDIEEYTTDHFVYRNFWVKAKTNIFLGINNKLINDVYIAKDGYLINRFKKPNNTSKIINILNKFYDNNPNIKINIMLVPTASSIYQDKLPKYNLNYDEEKVIQEYQNNLKLNFINVYNELLHNKDKYELYYKTDHHWTSYGAYIAYQSFLKEENKPSYNLNDFKVEVVNKDFLGTIYSKVFIYQNKDIITQISLDNSNFIIKHYNRTTDSFYEEKYLQTKDKYSYFLGNNEALIEIENLNYQDNDNIIIIKDSYANAFVPLISYHYKNIYVIDPRFYNLKISDFIKDNNIQNVLILYNVGTIDTDTGITNIR